MFACAALHRMVWDAPYYPNYYYKKCHRTVTFDINKDLVLVIGDQPMRVYRYMDDKEYLCVKVHSLKH